MELQQEDTDPLPLPLPLPSSPGSRWSDLIEEVLHQILSFLPIPDISRFGSICTSWHSATLTYRSRFRPPPIMVVAHLIPSKLPKLLHYLPSPNTANNFLNYNPFPIIPPQALTDKFDSRRLVFSCSGYFGWLASQLGRNRHQFLFNPISKQHLCLPPIQCHEKLSHTAFTSPDPAAAADDCTVISCLNPFMRNLVLLSCRPKEDNTQWCRFHLKETSPPLSMTFHMGRLLYVLLSNARTMVLALEPPPHLKQVAELDPPFGRSSFTPEMKLVESGKDLLLVAGKSQVFKLEEQGKWERITSLGEDRVLLVSRYGADSFSTKEVVRSGFRPNCIYYLFNAIDFMYVYSMEDGTYERVWIPHGGIVKTWLVPQGW